MKNSLGALVIGATVNDASTIGGLSNPGIAALNGLMQGGNDTVNALGGALQNLDAEDVRTAASSSLRRRTSPRSRRLGR